MEFDGDSANLRHIARHKVAPNEVEEVLSDRLGDLIGSSIIDGEERFQFVGATMRDRVLIVAFTMSGDRFRPVTAYDADRFTARQYREGGER